jgi:hypothetical protein
MLARLPPPRPAGRVEGAGKRKPGSWAIGQPPNTRRHPDRQRSPIAPQSLPGRLSGPGSTSNVASFLPISDGGSLCISGFFFGWHFDAEAGARSRVVISSIRDRARGSWTVGVVVGDVLRPDGPAVGVSSQRAMCSKKSSGSRIRG